MAMSMGSFASRVVATKVVATDGTGDFTDIQSAINALPAGGGVVYIKEGTYTITSVLSIPYNNIALMGAGKATKIQVSGSIEPVFIQNKSGVVIADIWFYGSTGASRGGLRFEGSSNCIVRSCWIDNCTHGVYINGSTVDVYDCYITSCTYGCFCVGNISKIRIFGNYIKDCTTLGVYFIDGVPGAVSDSIVVDNIINNCDVGILLSPGDYCAISANTCIDNISFGIVLREGAYDNTDGSDFNTVTGNVCTGSGTGLWIKSAVCDENVIVANNLNGNTIALTDSGTGTVVANNAT